MKLSYQPPPFAHPLIHYRDEHLVAVEKPSGLLSVPGRGPEKQDCLVSRVQLRFPSALVVHRLDMGTSGLVLFALDPDTQGALGRLFETRQVQKRYLACVHGTPHPSKGEIDLPLAADWPRRPRQHVDNRSGKAAHTRYRTLAPHAGGSCSRVELIPTTGRSHQLRVHMAELGHPILGDELYADENARNLSGRLLLHAEHLDFSHPGTGESLQLHSPAPF